ncbi:MAG TPA: hybrid sensor histidine kinase/response regulator, partial [Thermoanaerobaculia bacterium]|nr:hybrid sensor histidine kinase/response regulator [Thermoanaerobaculia bacterium]
VAGKVRLHLEPLDLARVALAAVDTVRPAAEAKDVRLVTDLPPEAGPVSGDADRLQQVVWNLLSNAIKFVPKGGRVEVRLAENDGGVDLTIADDGPGIKPEFLPYVFERFRQADSSSTRPHGGLGIGLAIVRHLVELHGGTVAARNRDDGTGAVFTVSLPRRAPAAPAFPAGGPRTADAWLEAAPSLEGLVVLVVDDEADARDMLSNVLALAGAHVREAASARDALTLMEKEAPDVLLSDIEMPERDGYTLIEEVRILSPERGGRVPAAAITAYASAEDRSRALASGFDAHVAKPVEPAELVRVVAALAGRTAKAAESPAATHSGAPTILIVEDDPDSAESLALLLEELGYEVTTAGDAKEALRQIERGAPRLALVDISLPGMSGLELAETIRRRAGPERTALVAMSGYGREEDIERSRAAGFTHHLVKPMDPVALGELLARLLAAEPARLS